jgi:hypothetical protein
VTPHFRLHQQQTNLNSSWTKNSAGTWGFEPGPFLCQRSALPTLNPFIFVVIYLAPQTTTPDRSSVKPRIPLPTDRILLQQSPPAFSLTLRRMHKEQIYCGFLSGLQIIECGGSSPWNPSRWVDQEITYIVLINSVALVPLGDLAIAKAISRGICCVGVR